jgi:hypothetical protein
MSDDKEHVCVCSWMALYMCFLVAIVVGTFTWAMTDYRWRAEAVRRGYAHVLVKDEYGTTKWEWLQK